MAKGIVIYYSRSGNTKEMAEIIAKSMHEAGLATDCKAVNKVKAEDLLGYDVIFVPARQQSETSPNLSRQSR